METVISCPVLLSSLQWIFAGCICSSAWKEERGGGGHTDLIMSCQTTASELILWLWVLKFAQPGTFLEFFPSSARYGSVKTAGDRQSFLIELKVGESDLREISLSMVLMMVFYLPSMVFFGMASPYSFGNSCHKFEMNAVSFTLCQARFRDSWFRHCAPERHLLENLINT